MPCSSKDDRAMRPIYRLFHDALSSKRVNFDEVQFFLQNIPKLIIFGTHNLQTFKHDTLINELLLMQFYVFNI